MYMWNLKTKLIKQTKPNQAKKKKALRYTEQLVVAKEEGVRGVGKMCERGQRYKFSVKK